ncbi:MAG: amidohydrolase family protein [Acidobacteria bacterium]|nr:amidohydrolase family protein [Acidobacteriota bacterium]
MLKNSRGCRSAPSWARGIGKSLGCVAALALTLGLSAWAGAGPVGAQEAAGKLALVGGMLLDGYEAPPIHHAAILIEGDRIVAVGPASEIEVPADATVIDTSGMTMLPGLIDLHVHLMIMGHGEYTDWFPIFTGRMEELMAISAKQLLLAGVTTAVDLGAPLEILDVRDRIDTDEIPGPRMIVSGPWIARRPWAALPDYFQYGISSPEEAAQKTQELIEAGVDVIKTWAGMTEDDIRAVVEVAHRRGVQVHSHLYEPEAIWGAIRGGTDVIQHAGSGGNPPYSDELIAEIAHRVRNSKIAARQFIEANVVLGMGTDSGSPTNFHTESAWREISALVVNGNPLFDINVLGYVERVIKGGIVYK